MALFLQSGYLEVTESQVWKQMSQLQQKSEENQLQMEVNENSLVTWR